MLRRAFRQHELEIHYQPVVETATGKVKGAEALLRWNSPELGWVSPSEFIPIAEENGLIVAIGEWVLREACGQLRAWLDQGLPTMRMCVNLSRCQLQREDFPAVVGRVIEEMRLAPELVELELSERGALIGEPEVLERLKELDALGVRLAIDDFGTGHAAIACLKRLPLDVLKIDRSYVASITTGNEDAVITAATIAMAHHLQLEVVAEGVESDEQKGYLLKLGCDGFQGFVFSRALPPEDFRRLVAGGSPL
jgi:diguanylate cyclase